MNSTSAVRLCFAALIALTAIVLVGCGSSKKVSASNASTSGASAGAPQTGGAAAAPGGSAAGEASNLRVNSQTMVATVQTAAGGTAGASSGLTSRSAASTAPLLRDSERVIYFEYDSFVLRDEARPVIEAHARRLMADRSRRLVIEGHADERGSREYNLALGQKRADAVVRALTLIGTPLELLEAVSFGEERPAVRAANEEAWSKNRRVELTDRR